MNSSSILAILSLLVCPAGYIALCLRMRKSGTPRPPYIPFFFVFGTVGGWMFGFSAYPSGLTPISIIFLVTLAPFALLVSSIYLLVRSERSAYHRFALWSGLVYLVLLAIWFLKLSS